MDQKTVDYLREAGMPDDQIADLAAGKVLGVTGDVLRRWMAHAYRAGQRSSEQVLREAEFALMMAADRAWQQSRRLERLSKIEAEHISFQSLVADCQCWFDGFLSAFVGKDSLERPWTPDTGRLRALNDALRQVAPPLPAADEQIPF